MARETAGIWEFVAIEDYQRPAELTTDAVRKGLGGWWDRLRGSSTSKKSINGPTKWRQAPDELLDQAAPPPNWQDAAGALTGALEHRSEATQSAFPAQLLVAPPHSGVSEIATSWAKLNDLKLVQPPATMDVLSGHAECLSLLDNCNDIAVVIPRLEKYYLRHQDGLALVRKLIKCIAKRHHPCVLTCDSWAWAFLRRASAIDTLLTASMTLQAFDHSRLEREFRILAQSSDEKAFNFLHADSGKQFRLSKPTQSLQQDSEREKSQQRDSLQTESNNTQLKHIAGYSRGLLKIAWSIWRQSLQLPAAKTEQESSLLDSDRVLWVKPWSQLNLPRLGPKCTESELLVLHALLLHGGLHVDLLPMVLPFDPTDINQSLHRLHGRQLLSEHEGHWEVSALGYHEARRTLNSEGFLMDDF